MQKKIILSVSCGIIILAALSFFLYRFHHQGLKYFTAESTHPAIIDLVSSQKTINERLDRLSKSRKYTFEKAYVELNPYQISPLSAIIIFTSDESLEVELQINDELVTTMSATKHHVIPIYGLLEDYVNKIVLTMDSQSVTYEIKTEKSNIAYPLKVNKASTSLDNKELYFTVASLATWLTGWDVEGRLRFYLTTDNRMDVAWLPNGHFLIGTTQDQTREQFVGFVEMDYLGKIYNYYTLTNGYSFEFQILSNGNYMLAGGNEAIYMDEQLIYVLNPATGNKESEINLSEIILAIDPDFNRQYLGAGAIRNGFYFNEDSNELIVSFRELNTIFSFNYVTKTLNWVFTSPDNPLFTSTVWQKYKVKSANNRYPLGQHTPTLTSTGDLAFFNNGIDRLSLSQNPEQGLMANYQNAYSSLEIYHIANRVATPVWQYTPNPQVLSIKYGLFNILPNNHKLADFGYILKSEYRQNKNNTISGAEADNESIYTRIIELDEKDNIVFDATSEEGKFRVFKHQLYNATTDQTAVSYQKIFNNIAADPLTEYQVKDIPLKESKPWIFTLTLTQNTFTSNYTLTETDDLDIYYINKSGKVYALNYKDKNTAKTKRVFNADLPHGEYAIYLNLNGIIYDPQYTLKY